MKSAVFYGKHDIRIEEIPKPEVGERDVLIRVMACGVCGTDVHIYEGDEGAAPTPPQTVLGHEFSGIVEAVGKSVRNVKPGDRVSVDPNQLCGSCYYCRNGIGHFCENMVGIGTTVNGGFAEYCAVPESQVYHLADGTTFEQGAMNEPVSCCLHGIDECEIQPGSTVCIIGGGMIGLLMLQLTRLCGVSRAVLVEPVERKRRLAESLGADLTLDPFTQDIEAELRKAGIPRLETVIECAGLPSTMEQAIRIAGKRSVVMLFGLTRPQDTITLKPFTVFQKEIRIKASYINPYTQQRALDLINSGRIDVSSMVEGVYPLTELNEILSDPARRREGKCIIHPWE